MRKEEILGLRWEQVDLDSRMITIRAENNKGKRIKHVPINADAEAVLQEQLKFNTEGGINYVFHDGGKRFGEVKTAWHKTLKRGGLSSKIRFHDLRHTSGW
jgi:integrase